MKQGEGWAMTGRVVGQAGQEWASYMLVGERGVCVKRRASKADEGQVG